MASFKVTDVLTRYDGAGDITTWIKQAKLAKHLLKLKNLAVVIPMFLDGDAFAVYDQLGEAEKSDESRIEEALLLAFACDQFSACGEFKKRVLNEGESVDVFVADLKRLAKLAGIGENDDDQLLKLSFVLGLPKRVSAQIRATPNVEKLKLTEILSIARAFVADHGLDGPEMSAVANSYDNARRVRCLVCGGPHFRRSCKSVVCFLCNERGHIARDCQKGDRRQGNDGGVLCAPATSPSGGMAH